MTRTVLVGVVGVGAALAGAPVASLAAQVAWDAPMLLAPALAPAGWESY